MHASTPAVIELVDHGSGRIELRGALTFATARRARAQGVKLLAVRSGAPIEIDCSAVTSSDSAGLAVLLDWLVLANRQGQVLHLTNLPAAIRAVAQISDVEPILNQGLTA